MKKYERRPVFLEPHVFVRSVFNNRIFAVIGSPFFVRSAVIAYTYPYSVQVMRASTIHVTPKESKSLINRSSDGGNGPCDQTIVLRSKRTTSRYGG